MPKIREKKTRSSLVYYYKFPNLSTSEQLDDWVKKLLSSAENLVQFGIIHLSNLYSSNLEDGGSEELTVHQVRNGILGPMRKARANHLAVHFTYRDAHMVLGVALGKWEVSLSSQLVNADKLTELAELLGFDKA